MAFKSLFQGSIIEICCDEEKVEKSSEVRITQKKKNQWQVPAAFWVNI